MIVRRSFARAALLASVAGGLLVGGSQLLGSVTGATPLNQAALAVQAGDYFFSAPDTVESGYVTLDFSNTGTETHHAQLVRLPDDLSIEQFATAIQGDERAALGLVKQAGGAAAIDPGWSDEAIVNLDPGTYALICVIPSPSDRTPHVLKGMIKPLIVTPAASASAAPAASGTVTLRDFTIDMPEVVPAGPTTYHVVNEGPGQPHEFAIVKLKPGVTADDARAAIMAPAGPPPFTAVGGFQAESVGGDGYVTLNLEPGDYAAICRVTEPVSGVSHVHLGMIKGFRVE
jgi:uncharacterized cupredoxin-like copper-binding protein